MVTCSICLCEVRETRHNKPIRCGHLFHAHCLEKWKNLGNNKCPVCRKVYDGTKYKVQITVYNNYENTSDVVDVQDNYIFDALDLFFDINNDLDLESLLNDFGVGMPDFDPSIFDTE